MSQPPRERVKVEDYIKADLSRDTNWWGAFVIGLAGTILVTGVTGPTIALLGSAAIPNFFFITSLGWLLCLFLAELAAMLPDRTGGAPSYAAYAFKDRLPRSFPVINGITTWMYWIGWWPVVAVNMIITGGLLASLFKLDISHTVKLIPGAAPVPVFTIVVGSIFTILLFIPAYLGIRFSAVTATVLGLLSMIPMTFLAVLPLIRPSTFHVANVWPLQTPGGFGFLSGHSMLLYFQGWALLTWNVIAMEAAACYIGECRNPERDAPIAMNLEGGYGVFIYTVLPLSMLAVLGYKTIQTYTFNPGGLFASFAGRVANIPGINQIVILMLIVALTLSNLNAVIGCARSLYQISLDGDLPRSFAHKNKHNVPDVAMGLNVILNVFLIAFGAPAVIYVFSNVGYVGSFVPVLLGYYFLRRWRPEIHRPFRLPEWMKYVALAVAAVFAFTWFYGLPACALHGCALGAGNQLVVYFIGWIVLLSWFPLWWWRKAQDRRLGAMEASGDERLPRDDEHSWR